MLPTAELTIVWETRTAVNEMTGTVDVGIACRVFKNKAALPLLKNKPVSGKKDKIRQNVTTYKMYFS